jgi:deoxyadenosine/deoxycytidine kinase
LDYKNETENKFKRTNDMFKDFIINTPTQKIDYKNVDELENEKKKRQIMLSIN